MRCKAGGELLHFLLAKATSTLGGAAARHTAFSHSGVRTRWNGVLHGGTHRSVRGTHHSGTRHRKGGRAAGRRRVAKTEDLRMRAHAVTLHAYAFRILTRGAGIHCLLTLGMPHSVMPLLSPSHPTHLDDPLLFTVTLMYLAGFLL